MKYTNFSTFIFEGFYESQLYNSDKLYWANEYREENEPEWNIDFPKYEKEVSMLAASLLEKYTKGEIISKIEFIELDSPREYNFRTDRFVLNVEFDEDKLGEFLIENKEDFDAYLRANWSSYDGFISFVPNNYEDFFDYWENDGVSWQVAIEYYILRKLCGDEWNAKEFHNIETEYHCELYEETNEIFYNCLTPCEN